MKRFRGRTVEPELLDELPPADPRALRSRRDLRLLNLGMGHPLLMAHALLEHLRGCKAPRIVELGAGDGHFLLSVAKRVRPQWPSAEATLVDRLDAFDPKIQARFSSLGWSVRKEIKTASEWLQQSPSGSADAIVFNLFLHQFRDEDLSEMLGLAAKTTNLLIALEPRRSWLSRLSGRLLWAIGCGPVTRHDADISIRAGFYGTELSAIWPNKKDWSLIERPAGLFSHLFIARRANQ
jgi:Methyltransferase domain